MINVVNTPSKIPSIKPIFNVTNKVMKKMINCSFPMENIFFTTFGDANLYPVNTSIAINAGNGIRVSCVLNNAINNTKKKA